MQFALLIGIGAGLASAALFASAWTGTALGVFFLRFLSSLPVAIAGLGWGWGAGSLAAIAGAAVMWLAIGPALALLYLIAVGAPAACFSYLALLNRPADGVPDGRGGFVAGGTEWYPIGRIVGWASLWAALAAAAALLTIGTDTASVRASMEEMLDRSQLFEVLTQGGAKVTPESKKDLAAVVTAFLPLTISMMWFAVIVLNMWLAGRITLASGRLARPWPDLSSLSLPPLLAIGFGIAVLATQLSDLPGLIAFGFTGAFMFAFMLVGLGLLHRLTRGLTLRPAVLAMVYTGLVFMPPFSQLLVALVGLAEPFLRGRIPPGAPPPSTTPT
jgi:hypothetical protein